MNTVALRHSQPWKRKNNPRSIGLLVALATLPTAGPSVEAQSAFDYEELGQFYVHNHPTGKRGGPGGQNFAALQGPDDLIYVANSNGVLVYDGVSWDLIRLPDGSPVVAMGMANVGATSRIFVGGFSELGYLAAESRGDVRYVSLVDHLSDLEEQDLGRVKTLASSSSAVYFQTDDWLIRWDGDEMKKWRAETRFGRCSVLNDVLYVSQEGRGLMRLESDSLEAALGPTHFPDRWLHSRRVAWGDDKYLVVTNKDGILRCPVTRDDPCSPVGSALSDYLADLRPTHALVLPSGILVVSTWFGGAVLLDRDGRLLRVLNEDSGLLSESVWHSFLDRQGGLWLILNDGLSRVELGKPLLTAWTKDLGMVVDMARHRGRLYVAATSAGLAVLEPGSQGEPARFRSLLDPSGSLYFGCSSLLSTPQGLLAGCRGLHNLDHPRQLLSGNVIVIHRSRKDPKMIYAALEEGLVRLRLDDRWTSLGPIEGPSFQHPQSITEDSGGRLWVGSRTDGVLRLEPPGLPTGEPMTTRFGMSEGLPAGETLVTTIAGRAVVSVYGKGLFRPGPGEKPTELVPDTTFDPFLPRGSGSVKRLLEDSQGRVWIVADEDSGVATPTEQGGYRWEPTALRRAFMGEVHSMRVEPDRQKMWVGVSDGLVQLSGAPTLDASDYPVWIRNVTTGAYCRRRDRDRDGIRA